MRIASYKTIKNNKRTRISYAMNALERDSLNDIEGADWAFDNFLERRMSKEEMINWALREIEFRQMKD